MINNLELIDLLLTNGLSPEDIYGLAQEATEKDRMLTSARENLVDAMCTWMDELDVSYETKDRELIKKALIDIEKQIQKIDALKTDTKKTSSAKRSDDEIIKDFLKGIGF